VGLDETAYRLARGLAPLLALGLGLALERLAPHAALRPAWRANLGIWLAGVLLVAAVCGACGFTAARWAAESGFGLLPALGAPAALAIALTVLALDAVSYLWHRANHRVPVLWRFHRVHHADADFHVSTALRFHPGEILLSIPVRVSAIVLLGAPPAGVILFEALFGVANVLEHGNFDAPPRAERALTRVLITPTLHRRHHIAQPRELDTNFGTIFSLWDRAARTLRRSAPGERFATGLPGCDADPASLAAMLREPLR
jgi:sterol desaturase/sphingolipid hydroxylase (fatty acid hydroxylase superfamily)